MSITTLFFFCFVAGVVFIYYVVPKKAQWVILLIASIGYYLTADLSYMPFMAGTIVSTYLFGLWLQNLNNRQKGSLAAEGLEKEEKKRIKETFKKKKRRVLALAVLVLVGILFVVKYTNFTLDNIERLSKVFGFEFDKPIFNLVLPLGISFYIFMSISYVVDLYREKVTAERNPFKFALFISFFPHVVQGPIARFGDLEPQLIAPHKFETANIKSGFELMLYGVFKKLVLADRIGIIAAQVLGNWQDYGRYEILLAAILYSVQIYTDFSGCMDIITGIAKMFGIELSKNFDHPYFSKNIPEFWRRWHASLGAWFKDYLFYPISVSKFCQFINRKCRKFFGANAGRIISSLLPIYAVWFATGIWHGATWQYVLWGFCHGTLVALSLIFTPVFDKLSVKLKINRDCFSFKLFQMIRTFMLCTFVRIIPYMGSTSEAFGVFKQMWTKNNPWVIFSGSIFSNLGVTTYDLVIIARAIAVVWIVSIMQEKFSVREQFTKQNLVFRWIVIYAAIMIIVIYGIYGAGFTATDFLYRDF
ncbi:MAG: MBOAT family protein [Lachnospiraceae bacterium]|nr:MBOAT family protein [Lachnospiraceae bacterium]